MTTATQINGLPLATTERASGPGCLVQLVWFVLIGWWLGICSIALAWLLNITIIGLPLGVLILNHIPLIITLQTPTREIEVTRHNEKATVKERGLTQVRFIWRALYFIFIGWWWSAIWSIVAYLLCATILLIPFGMLMFRYVPMMTTLKRY
jgi:uncharacterized membrane protein YccF (DUF307 family)